MVKINTFACCSNKGPLFEKVHSPGAIITEITVYISYLIAARTVTFLFFCF